MSTSIVLTAETEDVKRLRLACELAQDFVRRTLDNRILVKYPPMYLESARILKDELDAVLAATGGAVDTMIEGEQRHAGA
jgi:hypothetical protein